MALNGDEPAIGSGFPITDQTLRLYKQNYEYDEVGNFVTMQHIVPTDTISGWIRHYECFPDSNRLRYTWNGSSRTSQTEYLYDTHGNMLNLANVVPDHHLQWDHRDMIKSIVLSGEGTAFYQYDTDKQRTRKRIVNQNGLGGYWERIYLGGYERYRRYNSNGSTLVEEIETHHLFEGEQRVLLVDDVITAKTTAQPGPNGLRIKEQTLFRYQYGNHLGSTCLELDQAAGIISYEEYHPYGTSAYRAVKSGIEAPPKRYRYTGMERDEESGLNYHSARYMACWIARWLSWDQMPREPELSRYSNVRGNPITFIDRSGYQEKKEENSFIFWLGEILTPGIHQASEGVDRAFELSKERAELLAQGNSGKASEIRLAQLDKAIEMDIQPAVFQLSIGALQLQQQMENFADKSMSGNQVEMGSFMGQGLTQAEEEILAVENRMLSQPNLKASSVIKGSDPIFPHLDINFDESQFQSGKLEKIPVYMPTEGQQASIPTAEIQLTQSSIGNKANIYREMVEAKSASFPPLDVIKTPDSFKTLDNTRAAVLIENGEVTIWATIHQPAGLLPKSMQERFGDSKTWEEAVKFRESRQTGLIPPKGALPKMPKRNP